MTVCDAADSARPVARLVTRQHTRPVASQVTTPVASQVTAPVTKPAAVSNTITTLAEIRRALATDSWPTRGLAVRAGIVAIDPRFSITLLHIAQDSYMPASHLWLRIASRLEDGEPLVAALALAAQCAYRGGNHSAARNCIARAEAAARLHRVALPAVLDNLSQNLSQNLGHATVPHA